MAQSRRHTSVPLESTGVVSLLCGERSLLDRSSLFRNVAPESVVGYLESCRLLRPGPGEVLIRPDRRNRFVFLVLHGELEVFLDLSDCSPIASVAPGECVGELSIIDNEMPSAFVVAHQESELLAIDHDRIWAMVDASHTIARNLLRIVTQRVRHSDRVIAHRTEALREYQRSSTLDALTDLHNRRWLEAMFARELERCAQESAPVSLLLVDIDNFKACNDSFGHLVGDEVLRTVAQIVRTRMRPNDMSARFGGDELAILLPDCDLANAETLAERLRGAVAESTLPGLDANGPPSPTVSIGVSSYRAGDSLDDLINRADGALYEAKLAGRDCVRARG